jgi:cytochrome c
MFRCMSSQSKRAAVFTGLVLGWFSGPEAVAQQEGAQLVDDARCYICRQMQAPLLGPPYIAIAARHAPRKEVMAEVLAQKIVRGGGGNWGLVPMVPNQRVTIDEARVMSAWILSLADEG